MKEKCTLNVGTCMAIAVAATLIASAMMVVNKILKEGEVMEIWDGEDVAMFEGEI